MKVAVLGASGRAGAKITNELAARGHQVVGIARSADRVPVGAGISAIAGEVSSPDFFKLIRGCDAVISALHFNVSAEIVLSALKEAGVNRLLVTGGAASLEIAPGKRVLDRIDFRDDWKELAMLGVTFLERLRDEKSIEWTFFSPAELLFEGPRLGRYRLGGDQLITDQNGESKISFADYAIAMVDELEQSRHSGARFTAAY